MLRNGVVNELKFCGRAMEVTVPAKRNFMKLNKRTKRPADYREEERTRILENRGTNVFLDRLNRGEV